MYEDIKELINSKKNIKYVDFDNSNQASSIVQIILSMYDLNNITIMDTHKQINFIRRNLKLDPTIKLLPNNKTDEIRKIIKEKKTQLLYIYHHSDKNQCKLEEGFDYTINVFDKFRYEIVRNKHTSREYAFSVE